MTTHRPPAPRRRVTPALLAATFLLASACAHGRAPAAPAAAPEPWYHGGVVYGVAPTLFGPHPLQAVTTHLDDLASLGVDALWLAPVNATDDPGGISYAITDYLRVRPDYGTAEDLRALVRAAHARHIRVLLDFVPNHTSTGHPWHRDAEARGPASPWYRFYLRDARGDTTWDFDWKNLRKLDYGNPEVRRSMTEAFAHWVRDFDVDGFRVDAAWGIRERTPDFWPELTAALRRIRPDQFLLAEAGAHDPYYVRSGFDAAYDWTDELGHGAWEHAFDDLTRVGPALDAALAPRGTPMDRVLRFLDNNDTGDRFLTRHGLATTRLAAVLLHTVPGIPALFTGDEVCAEYRPYERPPPLAWVDTCGLRPLYRRLAALREAVPALRSGAYRRLATPGRDDVFAFVRDAGSAGAAVVVLNFGPPGAIRLAGPAPTGGWGVWDLLAGAPAAVRAEGGGAVVNLQRGGGAILAAAPVALPVPAVAVRGGPGRHGGDRLR